MIYRYFVGDTKGWVEVRKSELAKANVLDLISTCSYEKGEYIYLDEDIDFSFFLCLFNDNTELEKIQVKDNYFNQYKIYRGGLQWVQEQQ